LHSGRRLNLDELGGHHLADHGAGDADHGGAGAGLDPAARLHEERGRQLDLAHHPAQDAQVFLAHDAAQDAGVGGDRGQLRAILLPIHVHRTLEPRPIGDRHARRGQIAEDGPATVDLDALLGDQGPLDQTGHRDLFGAQSPADASAPSDLDAERSIDGPLDLAEDPDLALGFDRALDLDPLADHGFSHGMGPPACGRCR
jgi:hypothetical protein